MFIDRTFLGRGFSLLLSAALAIQPALMEAAWGQQVIIDPNGNVGTRLQTGTRAPVVDIATPNSGGVSHNQYRRLNTPANGGVVLNNSASGSQTAVAGKVAGNRNLRDGSATTIVNEVTSTEKSSLKGRVEVAGDRANVIVANPNGLACNGCSFLNTEDATLTTGVPVIDGGNVRLDVTQGAVTIGRRGLDGAATGVGNVNLVGRTVVVDGKVTAIDGINVQGGAQSYDLTRSKRAGALDATQMAGSDYAIDGTAFGAMEAGRIQVIGNENGLGVRLKGVVHANTRDITISVPGKVEVDSVSAERNVSIQSAQDQVTVNRDVSGLTGQVKITSGQALSLGERSGIYGHGGLILHSKWNAVRANGDLQSGADISVSGRRLQFGAYAQAEDELRFTIRNNASVENATVVAQKISGSSTNGLITLGNAAFFSTGDVKITAQDLNFGRDVIVDGLTLEDSARLVAEISGDFRNSADMRHHRRAEITWGGNLYNEAGGVLSQDRFILSQGGEIHNAGVIHGDRAIRIETAGFFNNETGSVLSKKIEIGSTGDLINKGTISSEGDLALKAEADLANEGFVQANRSWWSARNITNRGTGDLRIARLLNLKAGNKLLNQGTLNSLGSMTLSATWLKNTGLAISQGGLTATATKQVNNQGSMLSAAVASLTGNTISNSGSLSSYDQIKLASTAGIANRGVLIADGALLVRGPRFSNLGDKALVRAKTGFIGTDAIVNSGEIFLVDEFKRFGNIDLFDNSGSFATAGNIRIAGRDNSSRIILRPGSTLVAGLQPDDKKQSLLKEKYITLDAGTISIQGKKDKGKDVLARISAGGGVSLSTPGDLAIGGQIDARGGNVSLKAADISIARSASVYASGRGFLTSKSGLANTGSLVVGGRLQLSEGFKQVSNSGVLSMGQTRNFNLSGAFINSGFFGSKSYAAIKASRIENSGQLQAASWMTLDTPGNIDLTGTTVADGVITLKGTDILLDRRSATDKSGGALSAGQLYLAARTFRNHGTISLSGTGASNWTLSDSFEQKGITYSKGHLKVTAPKITTQQHSVLATNGNLKLQAPETGASRNFHLRGNLSGQHVAVHSGAGLAVHEGAMLSSAGNTSLEAATWLNGFGEIGARNYLALSGNSLNLTGRLYADHIRASSKSWLGHGGRSFARTSLQMTAVGKLNNSGKISVGGHAKLTAGSFLRNDQDANIEATRLSLVTAQDIRNFGRFFGAQELNTKGGALSNMAGATIRAGKARFDTVGNFNNAGTIRGLGVFGKIGGSIRNSGTIRGDELVTMTAANNLNNQETGRIFAKVIALTAEKYLANKGQVGATTSERFPNAVSTYLSAGGWLDNYGSIRGKDITLHGNVGINNKEGAHAIATHVLRVQANTNGISNSGTFKGRDIAVISKNWMDNNGLIEASRDLGISTDQGRIYNSGSLRGRDITLFAKNREVLSTKAIKANRNLLVQATSAEFQQWIRAGNTLSIKTTSGGVTLGGAAVANTVGVDAKGKLRAKGGAIQGSQTTLIKATDIIRTDLSDDNRKLGILPRKTGNLYIELKEDFGPRWDVSQKRAKELVLSEYEKVDITSAGEVDIRTAGDMLLTGKIHAKNGVTLQAKQLAAFRNADLKAGTKLHLEGRQYLKNIGNTKLSANNVVLNQNWGWFYTKDWLPQRLNYNLTIGADTVVVNSDHRFVNKTVTFQAQKNIWQTDQVISARGITYAAGEDINLSFDPFKWRQNRFGGGYNIKKKIRDPDGSLFSPLINNPELKTRNQRIARAETNNPSWWEAVRIGLSGNILAAQGGGIELIAGRDIKLFSGKISTNGALLLNAGRNISIKPFYLKSNRGNLPEYVGWSFSDRYRLRGNWTPKDNLGAYNIDLNGASRYLDPGVFKPWKSPYRMSRGGDESKPNDPASVKEMRAYGAVLSGDLGVTVQAGNRLDIIGSKLVSREGNISLRAQNVINIAAAAGYREFQTTLRWTDSGFLSKERHTQKIYQYDDILTRSTLKAPKGDILLESGGVINSAGTEVTANRNVDIVTRTGDLNLGVYKERWVRKTSLDKDGSLLGGSGSHSLALDAVVKTGNSITATKTIDVNSGRDLNVHGGKFKARNVRFSAAQNLNIRAAINSFTAKEFEENDNRITITTINSGMIKDTASLPKIVSTKPATFSVGGKVTISGYKGPALNDLILSTVDKRSFDNRISDIYTPKDGKAARDLADNVSDSYVYKLPTTGEYAYIRTLLRDHDATYEAIRLRDQSWYDKQVRLNPTFQALLSVAVSAATGGLGGEVLNAVQKAALDSVLKDVIGGAITGNFDPEDALKNALTAGATTYISNQLIEGFGLENPQTDGVRIANLDEHFIPERILDRAGSQLISHGVNQIALGESPFEGLDDLGRSFLASEAMKIAQNGIGDLGKGKADWEGSLPHLLLHGGVGCVAMLGAGGKCQSGFFAGSSQSILSGSSLTDQQKLNLVSLAGALAGFVDADGNATNVSFGATIGQSGLLHNYLTHADQGALLGELWACESENDGFCDKTSEIIRKYQLISSARDRQLSITCGSDRDCVNSKLNDVATGGWDYLIANYTNDWRELESFVQPGDRVISYLEALQVGSENFGDAFIRQACGGVYDMECMALERELRMKSGLLIAGGVVVIAGAVLMAPEAAAACLASPACRTGLAAAEMADISSCAASNDPVCWVPGPSPRLQTRLDDLPDVPPSRLLDDIAPKGGMPSGYTKNADGSYTGPNGGIARDTGHVDANGNMILRRDNGGYYTVDANGNQVSVSSPYTTGAPPIHHVCTNKNCTGTANGGPWTPRFQELFDNAGLNINSEINKIAVPGHRGPHPAEYHQYVYKELSDATGGLTPNTSAYTNAVTGTLDRIKVEATTPGNQVNNWLTGK